MGRYAGVVLLMAGFVFAASMVHAQSASGSGGNKPVTGMWGGNDAQMEITAKGAIVNFGCGSGELLEPVVFDAQGRFRVKGTFQSDGPGPSYVADKSNPNATYSGQVKGATMQLEVEAASGKQTYTLVRGQKAKILGCK